MTKRNDLNDAGNSAHKPTQLVYVPEGLCDGTVNLLFLQLVTCAIPAVALCTHMVLRVCVSYCTECIFHTT